MYNIVEQVRKFNHIFNTDYTADANCKAAWLCNETSGNLADSSGKGHTATATATITYDASGMFGRCVQGDGDSAKFTASSNADFTFGTGDFTMIAAVYDPDSAAGLTCIFNHGYSTSWMLYFYPSAAYCYLQGEGGYLDFDLAGSAQLTQGWNEIVVRRIGTACTFWLNKVSQTLVSGDAWLGTDMAAAGSIVIGNYSSYFFDRKFDELGFFNRGLSSTEIGEIFDNGLKGGAATTIKRRLLMGVGI